MADTMTSQNIELSSWDTLYKWEPLFGTNLLPLFSEQQRVMKMKMDKGEYYKCWKLTTVSSVIPTKTTSVMRLYLQSNNVS